MRINVCFYSYFKDLTGCPQATEIVPGASTIGDLLRQLFARFPRLAPLQNSVLVAVGVEYQDRRYVLQEGDEVSLFPPVQGGQGDGTY
jgi:molybdopterin converting factor small subunit